MAAAQGTDISGSWLSVPEYLVHRARRGRVGELSLACRTGLFDQDTAGVWQAALDLLGAPPELMPPLVTAGTAAGRISRPTRLKRCGVRCSPSPGTTTWSPRSARGQSGRTSCTTRSAPQRRWSGCYAGTLTPRPGPTGRERHQRVQHLLPGRRILLAGTKAGCCCGAH